MNVIVGLMAVAALAGTIWAVDRTPRAGQCGGGALDNRRHRPPA